MKKRLIPAILLVLVMVFAMSVSAFADAVVFSPSPKLAPVNAIGWEEDNLNGAAYCFVGYNGVAEYAPKENAVKFHLGNINIYCQLWLRDRPASDLFALTHVDYPYMVYEYKVMNASETTHFQVGEDGYGSGENDYVQVGVWVREVISSPWAGMVRNNALNFKFVDYENENVTGAEVYLRYVAFCATEEEAKAFDYEQWLKEMTGETITEKYDPTLIKPKTEHEDENPGENTDAGLSVKTVAMICGAIALVAVAAVVVVAAVTSKKRK